MLETLIIIVFFIAFVAAVLLGMYGLSQGGGIKAVLFWALSMTIAVWALAFCGQNLSKTLVLAQFWTRLSALGWGIAYTFILHLALVLSGSRFRARKLSKLLYVPSAFIVFVYCFNGNLAARQYELSKITVGWASTSNNTFWEHFFHAHYIVYTLLAVFYFIDWGRKTSSRSDKKAAFYVVTAILVTLVGGTFTDLILNNFTRYRLPSMAPIFILLPLLAFFYAIRHGSLIKPRTSERERSSSILTENTIFAFTNYFALILLFTAVVLFVTIFVNNNFPHKTLLWAAFDVLLGSSLLAFRFLPVSNKVREFILSAVSSVFMVMNVVVFHWLGVNNVSWIIPILIIIPITIISQPLAFWTTLVSALVALVLYFVLEYQAVIVIHTFTYIMRALALSMTLFLTWMISKIWISRRNELDEQVRFQFLLSAIVTVFNNHSVKTEEKLENALQLVRDNYQAHTCHFAADSANAEEGDKVLILAGMPHHIEQSPYLRNQLDILEKTLSSALEYASFNHSVQQLASYDQVTGLAKRAVFNQKIRDAIAQAQSEKLYFALLHINIDSFKEINNTVGFDYGDQLLHIIAKELQDVAGQDGVIYRFGGDDFLVMGKCVRDEDSALLITKNKTDQMMAARKKTVEFRGHEFFVSLSIGAAIYPLHGKDPETLLKHANLALFRAKNQGRNQVCFFSDELKKDSFNNLKMIYHLQQAVEHNKLYLTYQAQTDVVTDDIIAFEALVRWTDAEYGQVPPSVFIPLAEQSGLIEKLGAWVIHEACRQLAHWQAQTQKKYRMGINLSPRQLYTENVVTIVHKAIVDNGLDPQDIDLEVTEGIAIKKYDQIFLILHKLKNLGVDISIDDFGSEYASLLRLKSLPVDRVKIDMFYIQNLSEGGDFNDTVKAMITLGKRFGLKVLAEGVETQEHLNFLREHHCDEYQGYLKSMPLIPSEIDKKFHGV